jgi:PPOX class probable F420-dependent enzyme
VTRTDDRHTAQRLPEERSIWLGTVHPDGRPHNVSAWFAWHDPMVLIFSMPKTAKVRICGCRPRLAWRWDSADGGQDIVLAEGRAELIAGTDRHPPSQEAARDGSNAASSGLHAPWRDAILQPPRPHITHRRRSFSSPPSMPSTSNPTPEANHGPSPQVGGAPRHVRRGALLGKKISIR